MSASVVQRLNDALRGRYTIERELGAGGMSTVFLATDLRHDRPVAVKVLRPELAAAVGPDRFLREITTTAGLRHPNILPLFDSGDADGSLFYVMPLVEGESLRDRLRRDVQLPMEDALRIADEVADALAYAHARGVIHRDIKPENILLEGGHAVVADFGIARPTSAGGSERLTSVGVALGTPHYMSPEQSNGEDVDERSDLYALACVTYEMIAGSPPFTGSTAVAVMARHAVDPVPSLQTVRAGTSASVATCIERALAKVPADRFASVTAWREALKAAAAHATPSGAERALGIGAAIRVPPPAPPTPLLGRDAHLEQATERLRQGSRLLTITGYGGTGKTRFSMELFRRLEAEFPAGAAFTSVASVTDPAEVLPTVAQTLGIAEAHGRSALDALCTVFGSGRVLLVVDNLEQVLESAGDLADLVRRCPALTVIATSRAPLKVGAETEFALPPLELPEVGPADPAALMDCPSVGLFVQRARKVQPDFALTEANAEPVAEICRRLDGLPLALELAAARVRILEPAALLQRLDHALDLLTSGDRDLPLRQRTLRTTISWSYSLLEPGEQRLLRFLSVFHDGWTLEAMEDVCYAQDDGYRALDELESLVEKGLVRVIGAGERYGLLETIRAFAAEQLHAAGEVVAARAAHADHFVRSSARIAADIASPRQLDAMRRARAEAANTLAATQWLSAAARAGEGEAVEKGLALCGHLLWPWHINGQHLTARAEVDVFLELSDDRPPSSGLVLSLLTRGISLSSAGDWDGHLRDAAAALEAAHELEDDALGAEAAMHLGYARLSTGLMAEARAALDESVALAERAGADFVRGFGLSMKGMLAFLDGDLEAGLELVGSALRLQHGVDDFEGQGLSLSFLAQMTFAQGDHAGAVEHFREAVAAFSRVGDRPEVARLHCEMGWAALGAGDVGEAQAAFVRAVRAYEEVGSPRGTGMALMGLAAVEAAENRAERAVAIAGAARELSERAGIVIEHPMDPDVAERIETLKATIPQGTLDGLEHDAKALTPSAVLTMVQSRPRGTASARTP